MFEHLAGETNCSKSISPLCFSVEWHLKQCSATSGLTSALNAFAAPLVTESAPEEPGSIEHHAAATHNSFGARLNKENRGDCIPHFITPQPNRATRDLRESGLGILPNADQS